MGRWIFTALVILLLAGGAYYFLLHEGMETCRQEGRDWDYKRWACSND